jgi:hypothetical protein
VTISSSTPMLAPAPGHAPGTGANIGLLRSTPARGLLVGDSALDRARDGWLMHTPVIPGICQARTFPASSFWADAYGRWLDHVWPAAACSHPVRLHGVIGRADPATGEALTAIPTAGLPDGVIYKPCGNRRAVVCPGCADTYRRDAFQLIRAGLAGGKGISPSVAAHPAVFATFTAPSFGAVHSRPVRLHSCLDRSACACKPQPCHARRDAPTCRHGVTLACYARHRKGDPVIGQPLCPDCYDHDAHVVWNNSAGELWRRTKQDIERHLEQLAWRRGYLPASDKVPVIRLSHGKVAEYQARGAVHFHVLLRLDGTDPGDPDRVMPPPPGMTVADLDDAIRATAANLAFRTRPHPDSPDGTGWPIAWGTETDVRVITMRGTGAVTDVMVASYLAKYSTKGTEPAGHASARITPETAPMYARADGTHAERLIHAAWRIGTAGHGPMLGKNHGWDSLHRWAHMLGFGGHFLTKARRYSVTFTALRQARVTYRRTHDTGPGYESIHCQEEVDTKTTIVLNRLSYDGSGWRSSGDALLANTAADQARKRRDAARAELAGEYASEPVSKAA